MFLYLLYNEHIKSRCIFHHKSEQVWFLPASSPSIHSFRVQSLLWHCSTHSGCLQSSYDSRSCFLSLIVNIHWTNIIALAPAHGFAEGCTGMAAWLLCSVEVNCSSQHQASGGHYSVGYGASALTPTVIGDFVLKLSWKAVVVKLWHSSQWS